MDQKTAIKYWLKSAKQNIKVAEDNFKLKHYSWSLFLWKLALEKAIKGIIVKKGQAPPPSHKLNQLIRIAGIAVDKDKEDVLKEITTFNLEARYDDIKFSFYKR